MATSVQIRPLASKSKKMATSVQNSKTASGVQNPKTANFAGELCRNFFYHSDATTLSSYWNALQWKHDIFLSSIQKAIFSSDDFSFNPLP